MSAHYTGEVDLQFLRHGQGQYRYPNSVFRYTGKWKAGTKSGLGVFEVLGGSRYEGTFVDGELEGKGSKQWVDGRLYEGEFNRGEASGEGHFTSPSGESYVGTWALNKRHGRGKLVLPNGEGSYVGEFQRHRFHGYGQLALASGFQFTGTFSGGLPHGTGAAVYPGGSLFHGPFDKGRKHGRGGKYVCGVTGICWIGEWVAGKAKGLPSKWELELDGDNKTLGGGRDSVGQATPAKPRAKAEKGGGGKKGAKISKKAVEEPETDAADKLVIAHVNDDGDVAALWCRCVRDVQDIPQPPPIPSELQEGVVDELTRPAKGHQREVVSDESGRTLTVTLHEVTESPQPGSISDPVPFFVRRPDATDVSESLGRFPVKGLIALFQRDERCYPKETTGDGRTLLIVPGAKPAPDTPAEEAEISPPAKGSKAPAAKSKGGVKGESELKPFGDDGIEGLWQVIRSEVQSNRCLEIRAGKNFSLRTPPLFDTGLGKTKEQEDGERRKSVLDSEENAGVLEGGGVPPEVENTREEDVTVVVHGSSKPVELLQPIENADGAGEQRTMMVQQHSPFAVCLDFRLDLMEAPKGESTDGEGGQEKRLEHEMIMRIVLCGNDVEVSAVIRLWIPPTEPPVGAADDVGTEADRPAEMSGSGASGALDNASPTTLIPPRGGGNAIGDSSSPPTTPTWYLHAISIRCGSFVGTVPCANPEDRAVRRKVPTASASESWPSAGAAPPRSERGFECDLAEWHALALVASPERVLSLCIDGEELELLQDAEGTAAAAGIGYDESELSASDAVVLGGGAGGEWASLAVKNLAVYNESPGIDQLRAITQVFRVWRERKEAARATDVQEGERPEWVVGADRETILQKRTVRGEAKIDKIVLPKVALEGGDWVLRVEDVSHGEGPDEHGSTGRARSAALAESFVSQVVVPATTATDEERNTFPPLPVETVKLERI
ncbi:unnamed protein product [Ectocarpus sp. CCAP 1310/34]|nr:unnamed protein product [Ectocarpus sp. CCAP 1310/34]